MCTIGVRDYSFLDDGALVGMTISGDTAAYSKIVKRHRNAVFGLSMSIVGNYHTAEDIAQETFINGYVKLSSSL